MNRLLKFLNKPLPEMLCQMLQFADGKCKVCWPMALVIVSFVSCLIYFDVGGR